MLFTTHSLHSLDEMLFVSLFLHFGDIALRSFNQLSYLLVFLLYQFTVLHALLFSSMFSFLCFFFLVSLQFHLTFSRYKLHQNVISKFCQSANEFHSVLSGGILWCHQFEYSIWSILKRQVWSKLCRWDVQSQKLDQQIHSCCFRIDCTTELDSSDRTKQKSVSRKIWNSNSDEFYSFTLKYVK